MPGGRNPPSPQRRYTVRVAGRSLPIRLALALTATLTAIAAADPAQLPRPISRPAAPRTTAAPSAAASPPATAATDPVSIAREKERALSEAASRLSSAAEIDRKFLSQALVNLDAAAAGPAREKVELLLADEEDAIKGFRLLRDGLGALAVSLDRSGEELAAQRRALESARTGAPAKLAQLLDARGGAERLAEDRRLAALEVDGARQRLVQAQSEANRALAAHRKASGEAASLSSPLGQLGGLVKRALSVAVPVPVSGADWVTAHVDRRRKALEDYRIALVQEREYRAKLELDLAYRRLEAAQLDRDLREGAASLLGEALERLRKQFGVTPDEVAKAEAAARQAQAEAATQKVAAARTAEMAREEKDAAASAESRLKLRQEELEKARASATSDADRAKLDARGQLLEEEARATEDRRALAGEREQQAALESDLAGEKERLAGVQSGTSREVARVVQDVIAHPERTVAVEVQYRTARAGQAAAQQETRELAAAADAVRGGREALGRRAALLAERVSREKERPGPADGDRGQLLRAMQDGQKLVQERMKVAESMLATHAALRKVQEDRVKLFGETMAILGSYRRESETKVTAVSLSEGYDSLRGTLDRAAREVHEWPGRLRLHVSQPENRERLVAAAGWVFVYLLAAIALFAVGHTTGAKLSRGARRPASLVMDGLLDLLGPLLMFAFLSLSARALMPGTVVVRAVVASPFLFVAAYRLLRRPLLLGRAAAAELPGSGGHFATAAVDWCLWAARWGALLLAFEHILAQSGASRTILFLAQAVRNVGWLGLLLGLMTAERQTLGQLLSVSEEGAATPLRRWYNRVVVRLYMATLAFLAIVGGLWLSGYQDRAEWLLRSTGVTVVVACGAYLLQARAVSALCRFWSSESGRTAPWWQQGAVVAVRGLFALLALLVILDAWSLEVRILYGLVRSPVLRDVAARVATVFLIGLSARFTVVASRFVIYRLFALGAGSGGVELLLTRRGMTLAPLLTSVVRYLVWFIAAIYGLKTIGLDPTPLVAGAGVLGLAVGFGAQSLVKDVITGFFIITEDLISVGDIVEIDTRAGQVEEITVRVTKLRLYSGELRIIPNSEIRQIGNRSRGFMRAIVPVTLAPHVNVREVLTVLESVAQSYCERNPERVLGPPEIHGLVDFGLEQMIGRVVVKVPPSLLPDVERDLRLAIAQAFQERGIAPFARERRALDGDRRLPDPEG